MNRASTLLAPMILFSVPSRCLFVHFVTNLRKPFDGRRQSEEATAEANQALVLHPLIRDAIGGHPGIEFYGLFHPRIKRTKDNAALVSDSQVAQIPKIGI